MEKTARLAFTDFLRHLRQAYRIRFAERREMELSKADDVRLFAYTFGAGFMVVSLFIA